MKVLMLVADLTAGGKERRLVELLKGLSKYQDIKCELAVMNKEIHYTEVFHIDIKIHYLIRKFKKDPTIFFQLYKLCKSFQPDMIHSWGGMTSVYAVPISKMLRIKLINGMIIDSPPRLKVFRKFWIRSKFTFPFSEVVLSNSYAGLISYKAPKYKSHCIQNGFDFSRIENLQDKKLVKEKYGIKTSKVVGMVASFSDRKDYDTYISATEIILSKNEDVTFLAIGDGINLNKCKERIKLEFRDKIKFLGIQKNVESIVNIFDVGVLSSPQEGISNSIMEYMALGKPVVATNGGGTKEIVLDKQTGYLVPPKSPEILAHKIKYLLDNPYISTQMGKAGRRRVAENFSLDKMGEKFVELYKIVLRDKK